MKSFYFSIIVALILSGCKEKVAFVVSAQKAADSSEVFVWQNDETQFRAYGDSTENGCVTPGIDVWSHSIDSICEIMSSRNLGCGGSVPLVDDTLRWPTSTFSSAEILRRTPEEVIFVLHYPAWDIQGFKISLDKQITITGGSNFCKVIDIYQGEFYQMTIATGIINDNNAEKYYLKDRMAMRQTDGHLIALIVSNPDSIVPNGLENHSLALKKIYNGEVIHSYIGSLENQNNEITFQEWCKTIKHFKSVETN